MIFGQNRRELRNLYAEAWRKHLAGQPMSPLEAQVAAVIETHPEYHDQLGDDDLERDYTPEGGKANPFLHMGLHLGLREQVATDRPAGIANVYRALAARCGDPHAAEHQMMEALAETLWEAQGAQAAPDEARYLQRLRDLTA